MKIAIVTGASSGMGVEFVKQISQMGLVEEIWVVARRRERLEQLAQQVRTQLRVFVCDLTREEDIGQIRDALQQQKPDVFMLVNNAGFAKFGGFDDVRAEDALSMIDLNIRALVQLTQVCAPHMPQGSHILQVASTAAFQPLPEMNVYAATKAFVLSYARALNRELQLKGITVTAVCPGWTKTEFFDVAGRNADEGAVRSFPFMSTPGHVVHTAIKDALKEREMSVYGFFNKAHLFFSKILPDNFIMMVWKWTK